MRRLPPVLYALLLAAVSLPAEVLLNQPLAFVDGRASTITSPVSGFKTWDSFSLANPALIRRITFIGAFIDIATPANNPVAPSGDTWNFELATDNSGNPGTVTGSQSLAFQSVAQQLLGGTTLAGQPVHVYRFTADLLAPLFVTGGETMWLSVFSAASNLDPRFGWYSGSGGDGVSKLINLGTGNLNTYLDRAMTLEGDTVPEPSSVILISAGGLLIGLYRRRG